MAKRPIAIVEGIFDAEGNKVVKTLEAATNYQTTDELKSHMQESQDGKRDGTSFLYFRRAGENNEEGQSAL